MDCDSQQGQDFDSSDPRKTFIILMFRLVGLFFFFLHLSVVVVDFIGIMKYN